MIVKEGNLSEIKYKIENLRVNIGKFPEIEKNYKELNSILDGFVADKAEFARLAGFKWESDFFEEELEPLVKDCKA